jgi:hypothetical protein
MFIPRILPFANIDLEGTQAASLHETEHQQTVIWNCLKGDGINLYEYLRGHPFVLDVECLPGSP